MKVGEGERVEEVVAAGVACACARCDAAGAADGATERLKRPLTDRRKLDLGVKGEEDCVDNNATGSKDGEEGADLEVGPDLTGGGAVFRECSLRLGDSVVGFVKEMDGTERENRRVRRL